MKEAWLAELDAIVQRLKLEGHSCKDCLMLKNGNCFLGMEEKEGPCINHVNKERGKDGF